MSQAYASEAGEFTGSSPNTATKFIMLAGGLMITIAMSVLTPVLPHIETALAISATDKLLVKMLIPIMGITMVIGAPATGFLVDLFGLRRILLVHSLLFAIGGTAGLYLSNLWLLLGSRLLVGVGAAGMATISMTLINTRLHAEARARWMGFHISTAMFGSLLVHPLAGALGEIGWRGPFAIYAAGLALTVAAVFLREPRVATRRQAGAAPLGNPFRWFPLWFLPLALVLGAVTYLPNVYIGFVARSVGVTSPSMIAMLMLADAIIGAFMALFFGQAAKRISSRAAFMFSFACVGAGMLVVGFASHFAVVVAGMLIFGLGIGWFVPNLMVSLSHRVSPAHQGRAVGIVKAAHYIASPLGVLAVEPIARAGGPSSALIASGGLALGVAGIFAILLLGGHGGVGSRTPLAAE